MATVRSCSGTHPDSSREAVTEQMEKGFEIGPQSPLAGEVAGLICELTGMDRVTFCNTGSEAVMAAIRVARTVTGRNRFVFFSGDYHGTFDEVLMKGIRKGRIPACGSGRAGYPAAKRRAGDDPRLWNGGIARIHPRSGSRTGCRDRGTGSEPSPRVAAGRVPPRDPEDHRGFRHGLHLRRGRHGIPGSPWGCPGPLRDPCRPGNLRQGDRRRTPHRRAHGQLPVHGRPGRRLMAVWRRFLPRDRCHLLRRNFRSPSTRARRDYALSSCI